MNVQRRLIRKIIVCEFELGHNAAETRKSICCAAKSEGAAYLNTVTW